MKWRRGRVPAAVDRLLWACEDVDLRVALGACTELRDHVERLEHQLVDEARKGGITWAEIALWTGFQSRQAAHARASRRRSIRPTM